MTEDQVLEITVTWQGINDSLLCLQESIRKATNGTNHNQFIQALETMREDLGGIVSQATGNGDATWPLLVDEEPDWGGDIPFSGEVSPHETRAREAAMSLAGERFNRRQREMARETGTSPLAWK